MHEHHNKDLDRAISQYKKALKLVEGGDNGLEMNILVKFSIWRCEMKKGALWKAVGGFLSRENRAELAPLPQLPIKRQVGEDEDETRGAEAESNGKWIAAFVSGLAKARYVLNDFFFEHKGTVFGFNQSEDLGHRLRWDNILLAILLLLLVVSLFRALLKKLLK